MLWRFWALLSLLLLTSGVARGDQSCQQRADDEVSLMQLRSSVQQRATDKSDGEQGPITAEAVLQNEKVVPDPGNTETVPVQAVLGNPPAPPPLVNNVGPSITMSLGSAPPRASNVPSWAMPYPVPYSDPYPYVDASALGTPCPGQSTSPKPCSMGIWHTTTTEAPTTTVATLPPTTTEAPDPCATTTPNPCATTTLALTGVATTLASAAAAGAHTLVVGASSGFAAGTQVVIDEFKDNQEIATVTSLLHPSLLQYEHGSSNGFLFLASPLKYTHDVGAVVAALATSGGAGSFKTVVDGYADCPAGYEVVDLDTCMNNLTIEGTAYTWAGSDEPCESNDWPGTGCFANGSQLYYSNCGASRPLTQNNFVGICKQGASTAAPAAPATTTTAGPSAPSFGEASCPCIGVNGADGTLFGSVSGKNISYPADLGARCSAWDESLTPGCPGASWCTQKWCYVDPCNCLNLPELPKPSSYLGAAQYQGHSIYFSYATCGSPDSYSATDDASTRQSKIEASCAKEMSVDVSVWGKSDCPCQGFTPESGTVKIKYGDKTLEYAADYGANCQAWDADNDPACKVASGAPDYCAEKWCYVADTCAGEDAQNSAMMPDATAAGKKIKYSYNTCNGTDKYTASTTTTQAVQIAINIGQTAVSQGSVAQPMPSNELAATPSDPGAAPGNILPPPGSLGVIKPTLTWGTVPAPAAPAAPAASTPGNILPAPSMTMTVR